MVQIKINIYQTVEVSDEQRKFIAATLDGPDAKKRIATRDEIKAFVWQHGSGWAEALDPWDGQFKDPVVSSDDPPSTDEGADDIDEDDLL